MPRGRSFVALMLLAAGLVACSKDPEALKRQYVAQGDSYLAQKKYPEAIKAYRAAVSQDGKFADARLKLADAYGASGAIRNALAEIVRAADLVPDRADVQIRAGRALLAAGQYPEAKARATAVLAQQPRNADALMLLGNTLALMKDIDGAIDQISQAIDQSPQITLQYANLGALYIAKGDRDAAESAFKRAVEVAPKSVDAHLSLANFYWAMNRREDAQHEMETALSLDPKSASANRALAVLYLQEKKVAEAERYLNTYADASDTVEARLVLADYYAANRNTGRYTQILNELVKDPAGFVPATLRLATSDFGAGRRAAAYQKLETILKKEPRNESALEMKARFLLAEGKNPDALTVATSLVDINQKSAPGLYLQGLAMAGNGSIADAIESFKKVLQVAPSAVPAQIQLAGLYLADENGKAALDLAQQALKSRPNAVGVHVLYARALLKSGDVATAERELVMLAKTVRNAPIPQAEVQVNLGMVYESKGELNKARAAYQQALDLQPNATSAVGGLVGVDLDEKKFDAARRRVESGLAKNPNDVPLSIIAANVYAAMSDWPKAEAAYRRVIELDARNIDARAKLGGIYFAQNRLDDARKSFEYIVQHQPKPIAAETTLGLILTQQGKRDEARTHFERALELDPHAGVAANNLAWDYAESGGNLDTAMQLAQTAKASLPENATVSDTLGWIYYKKGLIGPAINALRDATRQSPSSPEIHYHLGLAYLKDGNKAEAKTTLERVLKLNPQFPAADEIRRLLASTAS